MTSPTFCNRPCDQVYADLGYRVMLAPNRYRKLFGPTPLYVGDDAVAGPGTRLLFMPADQREDAKAAALEMQRADWPELAHLAEGMAPHINMFDEVLVWRAEP